MNRWQPDNSDVTLAPRAPAYHRPHPDSMPGQGALGLASALFCLDREPGSLLQALSLSCPCALGGPLSAGPGFFLDITCFTFPNSETCLPNSEPAFPGGSVVKNLPANAGDPGSIPGLRRSPGEGNGNPL